MVKKDCNSVFLVAGLGYGDEGKGSVVDYLVREYGLKSVIRYNGGSQAGHNVVSPEGLHHCFSQFGSGTLVPGVKTFLSRHMLINPFAMEVENEVLSDKGITDAMKRLVIDSKCPVITSFNIIINRMLEASRGNSRHGSCGKGIGQTAADKENYGESMLFAGDLADEKTTRRKLDFFWRLRIDLAEQLVDEQPQNAVLAGYLEQLQSLSVDYFAEKYHRFAETVCISDEETLFRAIREGGVIFEGAQGALLDMDYGFWPYVTRTQTTFANAYDLITRSGYQGKITKIGVLRAYATRHGPGPFVTENRPLVVKIPPCHNSTDEWQGEFRIGWFDLLAAQYGLDAVGGIDALFLTNLDRFSGIGELKVCFAYRLPGIVTEALSDYFVLAGSVKGQTVGGIRLTRKAPGIASNHIARLLVSSKPIYNSAEGWDWQTGQAMPIAMKHYTDLLANNLKVNIPIISLGPTAADKTGFNLNWF